MKARTVKFILVGLEDVNELWDMCLGIGLNENNFTKMTADLIFLEDLVSNIRIFYLRYPSNDDIHSDKTVVYYTAWYFLRNMEILNSPWGVISLS